MNALQEELLMILSEKDIECLNMDQKEVTLQKRPPQGPRTFPSVPPRRLANRVSYSPRVPPRRSSLRTTTDDLYHPPLFSGGLGSANRVSCSPRAPPYRSSSVVLDFVSASEALASFGLEAASCAVLVSDGTYHLARRVDATLQDPTLRAVGHLFAETGSTSPGCPLPPGWPGAPASAATLCWANPLPKAAAPDPSEFGCLMAASTSPELNFVAYGGFLLVDRRGAVVAVQSLCVPKAGGAVLRFDPPRRWRPEFIGGVEPRLQAITLPALLRAGATSFCWVHPREIIASGPEEWAPSVTGAFLYQLADGTAVYFPLVSSSGASLGPLPAVPGGRWVAAAAATAALLALVAARRAR